MSKKIKVELNLPGINALMKSPEMQAHLSEAGAAVAQQASAMAGGEPYDSRVHLASWVAIANVWPASRNAAKKNLEENTLLKASGSVGLYKTKKEAKGATK